MKIIKKIYLSAITAVLGLFCFAETALAQVKIESLDSQLTQVPTQVKKFINPIVNIILLIVGVIAIGILVYGFIQKKRSNDPNSADGLVSGALNTVYVVVGIYVIKFFFFGA